MDEYKKIFKKNLLIEIGIIMIIVVPLMAGMWFLRSFIDNSVTEIAETRQVIAQTTDRIGVLLSLRNQYNNLDIENKLSLIENYIPHKDAMLGFQQSIESIALQHNPLSFGMSLQQERDPQSEGELGYLRYRLDIILQNSNQVALFINDLVSMDQLVTVDDNLTINSVNEGVRLVINIRGYYRI